MDVKAVNGKASQSNLTHAAMLTFGIKHILDYEDLVVAPGLIDTHVHMDQPGRTNWEGAQHVPLTCQCSVSYSAHALPVLLSSIGTCCL